MPTSYCDEASRDVAECKYVEEAEREIKALKAAMNAVIDHISRLHGAYPNYYSATSLAWLELRDIRDILERALEVRDAAQ